jgi:hypothetical protein
MTEAALLYIIMPVAVMISLSAWIAMVLYADAHPPAGKQKAAKASDEPPETAAAERKAA